MFVDSDAAHVAAINAKGLKLTSTIEEFCPPLRASLPGAVAGAIKRVLPCVKAHHVPAAMAMLAPHLAGDGYIASFQNGLNELVIAQCVGRARTLWRAGRPAGLALAEDILAEVTGTAPVRMGATIPVGEIFKSFLGIETIFFTFARRTRIITPATSISGSPAWCAG